MLVLQRFMSDFISVSFSLWVVTVGQNGYSSSGYLEMDICLAQKIPTRWALVVSKTWSHIAFKDQSINQFIERKDQSATYTDMHEIHVTV